MHVLEGHTGVVTSVAVSCDGLKIVSGSWDMTVRVWSAATGQASAFCASQRSQFCEFACRVWCVGMVVSVCCCACGALGCSGLRLGCACCQQTNWRHLTLNLFFDVVCALGWVVGKTGSITPVGHGVASLQRYTSRRIPSAGGQTTRVTALLDHRSLAAKVVRAIVKNVHPGCMACCWQRTLGLGCLQRPSECAPHVLGVPGTRERMDGRTT